MGSKNNTVPAYVRNAEEAAAKAGFESVAVVGVENTSAIVNEHGHKEVRVSFAVGIDMLRKLPFDKGDYANIDDALRALSNSGNVFATYHAKITIDQEIWDAMVENGTEAGMPAPRALGHWAFATESWRVGTSTVNGKEKRSIRFSFPQSVWVENYGVPAKKFSEKNITDYSKSAGSQEGDHE